jgi:hypothetical protein
VFLFPRGAVLGGWGIEEENGTLSIIIKIQ